MTITPEWAQVISEAIDDRLIDVHTGLPAQVQKYNSVTQTVDVELQLQRLIPKEQEGVFAAEDLPILPGIPVGIYRTGTRFLYLPPTVGDYGHVGFLEMSIDQWLSKGSVSNPGDVGRHTLSAGVFYQDLTPVKERLLPTENLGTDAILGAVGGIQLRLKDAAVEVVNNPLVPALSPVALSTPLDIFLTVLDTVLRGWVVAPTDGGAALKAAYIAAQPLPPMTVASSNLKAD